MIEVQSSITHKMKENHHIMGCGAWFQGSWTHILRDICEKCFESMKSLEMFWRQYFKCFRLLLLQLCRLLPIWKSGSALFVADGYEIADRINIRTLEEFFRVQQMLMDRFMDRYCKRTESDESNIVKGWTCWCTIKKPIK